MTKSKSLYRKMAHCRLFSVDEAVNFSNSAIKLFIRGSSNLENKKKMMKLRGRWKNKNYVRDYLTWIWEAKWYYFCFWVLLFSYASLNNTIFWFFPKNAISWRLTTNKREKPTHPISKLKVRDNTLIKNFMNSSIWEESKGNLVLSIPKNNFKFFLFPKS